jgi:hypothetical protein
MLQQRIQGAYTYMVAKRFFDKMQGSARTLKIAFRGLRWRQKERKTG